MEQFSITNQIGFGSLISDDGRGETKYGFVSTPKPLTLTIADIASVRPIAERDIPRHKPGLHPIEMLHPNIHTIVTTQKREKIYLFENIEDVINARKMAHGDESSLTSEGRLICAMYDKKRHLVIMPRKEETVFIHRSEISQSTDEWKQTRSPATNRKIKWAAAGFMSLAASGVAIFAAVHFVRSAPVTAGEIMMPASGTPMDCGWLKGSPFQLQTYRALQELYHVGHKDDGDSGPATVQEVNYARSACGPAARL